jgi:hypothetical protein
MGEMRLPDVIGIGCRRTASSSLHYALNQHPDIGKPVRGLHFFSERFSSGIKWYQEQLAPYNKKQILLEYSVSYSYPEFYKEAAKRIHKVVPDAKLFISVRNPVERVLSDYLRSLRRCEIESTMSFENVLEKYPVFLERGLYYRIISRYMDFFPRENLKILFFENLVEDPSKYLRKILDFIGVNHCSEINFKKQTLSGANRPRWKFFNKSVFTVKNSTDKLADFMKVNKAWNRLKEKHMLRYKRLLALNAKPMEIEPRTREQVRNYYAADIHAMEKLTGRTLSNWR